MRERKPKAPVYLAFELDALPKSDLAARSVGLEEGLASRALLSLWEYAWRQQVEWVRPEVLLGCCKGNERLAGALGAVAFGFLEPVPAGWTSEPCTPEPIPVAGYRVRGARRYLRIGSPQSKGGHAAKGNLIPGGPRRRQSAEQSAEQNVGSSGGETSADARQALGCGSADPSAAARLQRTANSEQRASTSQNLAGDGAPAGQPPLVDPGQTPPQPPKAAQEPSQAVLEGLPEQPAKRTKRARADAPPTSPHFKPLSDRLVEGYRRATGHAYVFQGPKDGAAVGRLCVLVTETLTVEDLGQRFESAVKARWRPATGIADFAGRVNDPQWGGSSTRAEDQEHGPVGIVQGGRRG